MRTAARRRVRPCVARWRATWTSRSFRTRTRFAQQAPVGLELRFAGAAQPDAALLALEVRPAADEPRQLVLHLRELDLQLALRAARPQREDVEDQARAVDDAAFQRALEVALLGARQRVVEDDEVGTGLAAPRRDLLDLALAGKGRGIGPLASAGHRADDGRAGRHGERLELGHPLGRIGVAEIECDEQRAVTALGTFKHPVVARTSRGFRAGEPRRCAGGEGCGGL